MKKLICTSVLCVILPSLLLPTLCLAQDSAVPAQVEQTLSASEEPSGWWGSLPKESKMLYTNLGAAAFIGLYGLVDWDYGSGGLHKADEKWFQKDSKYGGADKLGHFWSTYVLSDAMTAVYKSYGYSSEKANTYAALSALGVQAFMEIGDATSESQGFSWEDMAMNTAGAASSILMERYPELDRKIDFRVEYAFNVKTSGLFDDYSNQYYAMVLKLDGFDVLEKTPLKYLELHTGYYSRGYDTTEVDKTRAFYGGITFNFSRFFNQNGYNKIGTTLEYLQIPYTVPKVKHELD